MRAIVRLISIVLFVSAVWSLTAACVCATDIYVDNIRGDDGASGEYDRPTPERSGPVRTLAKALKLAGRGDRIVLTRNDRPYREPISLLAGQHSGYPSRPFTIIGNGAVIDGSVPIPTRLWEHYQGDVYRFQPSYLRYQQIFLDGQPAVRVPAVRSAKTPPKLNPLEWCFFRGYVYFAAEQSKRPKDYALAHAKEQTGITLAHVNYVKITDLTVQGFLLDGVNAITAARTFSLQRVFCRGNGRSGIAVGGASDIVIEQCFLGDNGEAQLLTLPFSVTRISDSRLLPKSAPAWVDLGGRVRVDGKLVEGGLEKIDGKNG